MAIRQCTRHHFYDDEKYKVCPICLSLSSQNHENEDRTVAYTTPLDNVADKTIGYQALKDDVVAKPTRWMGRLCKRKKLRTGLAITRRAERYWNSSECRGSDSVDRAGMRMCLLSHL